MNQDASVEGFVGRVMTLEEWAELDEDEEGELVDGRLEEEESPDWVHEIAVTWLSSTLWAWLVPRGGMVGGSGAKFAVRADRGRKPDLTAYLPGRRPPARGLIRVPPDIAVEVVSPRPRDERRDRVEKLQEYAAFGVPWYWIVHPQLRTFEIYELRAEGRYAYALGQSEGVIEAVPGCEGLRLDLDALWAEVERASQEDASESGEGSSST